MQKSRLTGCALDQTKIKGCSQLGRKVVPQDSKSNLPLSKIDILSVGMGQIFFCTMSRGNGEIQI